MVNILKQVINFILLGIITCILSMVILTHFMDPENALYFVPIIAIPIILGFLSITGVQDFVLSGPVQERLINIENQVYEKRKAVRYKVDHYPGEITLPDGNKINILLNEISSGGFQVSCVETTGENLSQKISQLREKESYVEITADIPFKEKIEHIKANCRIAYFIKNRDKNESSTYVAGLEVTEYKEDGDATLEKLIEELGIAA